MFELQTGAPTLSTRLMQVHSDLEEAGIVPTSDMAEHARALLQSAGVALYKASPPPRLPGSVPCRPQWGAG